MAASRRGLGRGLDALLQGLGSESEEGAQIRELPVHAVRPNPMQPRRHFDEGTLAELAASIREKGVLQPILVRPAGDGYELVAGERRWRAAQAAGLERVPAVVRDVTEEELLELALVENLQREDLNPLEEAAGYRLMMERLGLTQEEVAERVGKSRPAVANALRLLDLAPEVQELVRTGRLSAGHARALAGLREAEEQRRLARRAVEEGLSVRELERRVRRTGGMAGEARRRAIRHRGVVGKPGAEEEVEAWAERLRAVLGAPVRIELERREPWRGSIVIPFFGAEDLERLFGLLSDRAPRAGDEVDDEGES